MQKGIAGFTVLVPLVFCQLLTQQKLPFELLM